MKVLHAIIALFFIFAGLALYTTSDQVIVAFICFLIANVSLAAISLENALDKSPIERPTADRADQRPD